MKTFRQSSRRQERSGLTRTRLMQAAEKIFARDGFEAAKLEEIASDAGHTRGALYANFDGKEDLFFALLEQGIRHRIETVRREMNRVRDPRAKLFAVRHPNVRTRLAIMNRRFLSAHVQILQDTMTTLRRVLPVSESVAILSLSALSNALTLEHMLDRTAISQQDVRKILSSLFDSLTENSDRLNNSQQRS